MGEAQQLDYEDYEEADVESAEDKAQQKRGRSADYEKKRRRAEHILEQARLRELFGYDVDFED